jgi:disease resistance protein RPM1
LCFEDCDQIEDHHLAGIGNLLHLKCLRLNKVRIRKVPEEIEKLRHLETLDMSSTITSTIEYGSFPSTISPDRRLVHFVVTGCTTPDEFEGIQALEVMRYIDVFRHSTEFVQRLGDLKHLRKLNLQVYNTKVERDLASSVRKLVKANLRSLMIYVGVDSNNLLEELNLPAECTLEELCLVGRIHKVPKWMGSLVNLEKLHLQLFNTCQEEVEILCGIPDLRYICVGYYRPPANELKAAMEILIGAHPNHPILVCKVWDKWRLCWI